MRLVVGAAVFSAARPGNSALRIFFIGYSGCAVQTQNSPRRKGGLGTTISFRRPAAVDREIGAGNRFSRIGAKIDGEARYFFDGDKFLGGLRSQNDIALDLLFGHAARLGGIGDLLLDQRSPDITGADAVGGDAESGELQGDCLG